MSHFLPYATFNYPYLKIGLCDLFPVLLECITYYYVTTYIYMTQKISLKMQSNNENPGNKRNE